MGYYHVDPSALDPAPDRPGATPSVSGACGIEGLAAHAYEVAPGEAFVVEPVGLEVASVHSDGNSTTALVVVGSLVDDVHAYEGT